MRNFKKMATDEMYALWQGYLQTDWGSHDPLNQSMIRSKTSIRLTPVEMVKLTDEVFERLLQKEGFEIEGIYRKE